jgi:PAS domain S-box-containing protein
MQATDSGWAGLFRSAFVNSQNPMVLSDEERRIVDVNLAFANMLARAPSDLVGRRIYDFVVGGPLLSREEWRAAIARDEVTGEAELQRADGTGVRVHYAVHPEQVTGRRLVLFVAMILSSGERPSRRTTTDVEPPLPLSAREREVIGLVARGATSPEIARALGISVNTVRKHVASAMRKLRARSRAHLVAKTLAEGIQTG